MRRSFPGYARCFVIVVLAGGLFPAGCGGTGGSTPDAEDALEAGVPYDAEVEGPAAPDNPPDVGGEIGVDQGGEIGSPVPYVPPPLANPYVDRPYVQEFNPNPTLVEPGIGPLVAVVFPPEGHVSLDRPTQVTPRGYVLHPAGGGPSIVKIPDDQPDLVSAAASDTMMVLASPGYAYVVSPTGEITPHAAPDGIAITGLAPGSLYQIWVLTDHGLGRFMDADSMM